MPITQSGAAVQVNTTTGQNELLIQVYDLADGTHIAFYAQNVELDTVEAATALIGRRLDANGAPTGNEIVLSLPPVPAGFTPQYVDVIVLSDGTFVAMREVSNGQQNMNSHVLFQSYNANGSTSGSTITYGSTQNGNYTATYEFIANPAGGFAILSEIVNQAGPVQSIVTFSSALVQTSSTVQNQNYYVPFYLQNGGLVRISEAFDNTLEVIFPNASTPITINVNGTINDGIYREGPGGSVYIFGDYGTELAVYRVNPNGTSLKVATIPALAGPNSDLAIVDLLVRPDGGVIVGYSVVENGALDCAIRQFTSTGVADGGEVRLGFAGGFDGVPFLFNNANGSFSVVFNATTSAGDADLEVFSQTFNANSAPVTLTGTTGNDTLNGGDGNDTINGLAGNDVINAGNGNDIINPGDNVGGTPGFDTTRTGAGSDTVTFIDAVTGFFDLIYDYASSITVTINGANGTVVEGGGMGTDTLQHLDRIDGNSGGLFFGGTTGADTFNMSLSDASDFVVIRGGAGVDVINNTGVGFVRADYAGATRAVVIDLSLASGQVINDGHGNTETLVGVTEVRGGNFADSFTGSNGDDRFILDGGNDTVNGGAGFDRVRYDRNGYTNINVNLQAGYVTGQWNGNSFQHSLISIEHLRGSAGDDVINGSTASERFDSRGGNDTFGYNGGNDVITDFVGGAGASDRIDVAAMNITSFAQVQGLMTQAGANTVITFSAGNTLTLNNVQMSSLVADDFTVLAPGATFTGTAGNDTLTGSGAHEVFNGLAGNDVIDAGGGNDTINAGTNDGGLNGFETIRSGAGNDTITFADAGAGFFDLIYDHATSGIAVTINGANGTVVENGGIGTDTLSFVDVIDGNLGGLAIWGTSSADTYVINLTDATEYFLARPGGGNDTITNNGPGFIRLDYRSATGALTVDMTRTTGQIVNDGYGGTDTYVGTINEIAGSFQTDSFIGDANNNSFILNGGNDTVNGGAGVDRVRYDRNGVTGLMVNLTAGTATGLWNNVSFTHTLTSIEHIRGSLGDDTITGSAANERFESRGGNDLFVYTGGQDVITDFAGGLGTSDRVNVAAMNITSLQQLTGLMSQSGANTVITFSANDVLTLNNVTIASLVADDFIFAVAGSTVINGTAGDDTLNGTPGDDTINGLGGNDTINAGAGNDVINAGTNDGANGGFDTIRAGAGNDTISFVDAGTGFFDLFYDHATSGIAVTINGANGTVVENGGIGTDTLSFVDVIDGNLGGLSIWGTASSDTYVINLANASEYFSARPGGGNDTITNNGPGFVRVDYRSATGGIVVDLTRATGQIVSDGNGGTDTLVGTINEIAGSFQTDTITGNADNNSFILNGGNDIVNGGGGFDRLRYDRSGVNNLNVNLTTGIITGTWNNVAFNHTVSSIEHIRGSASNDMLIGSTANERFESRGGNDAFIYNGGNDVITDFDGGGQAQGGDVLDVRAMGISSWPQMQGLMAQSGANVVITFSPGNTVTLNNTTIANLFPDDFILTFAGSGITVNGTSGDDTLNGTPGNDTLNGLTGNDILNGEAGNDTINPGDNPGGFGGYDTIRSGIGNDTITFVDAVTGFFDLRYDHASSGIAVTINGATGQVVEQGGLGTDILQNLDRIDGNVGGLAIFGTAANDSYAITLSDATDFFSARPGGGNDSINWGGIGFLRLDYRNAPTGIGVDLSAASNQIYNDGYGGVDTILNYGVGVEVMGSVWTDTFNGSSGDDRFVLLGGNDNVNGGAGFDRVRYDRPEYAGIVVNLANNTASGTYNGAAFTHSLISVEWIRGSFGDDMITGSTRNERFDGRGGNDTFVFNGGQDRISDFVGGTGTSDQIDLWAMGVGNLRQALLIGAQVGADTVFTFAGGATLTLNNQQLSSLAADDIVTYVNTVQGTGNAESLAGTAGIDEIFGLGSADTLDGRGGGDVIEGGEGDDLIYYYGSDIAANIRGGNGTDTLLVLGGSAPTTFNLVAQGFEGARMELADNTSAIAWSTISYVYNSTWQSLTTNQVNDDGTRISTQFDRGNLAWSQIVEEYDAAGNRVIQRTFGDDNTYQFFYWDPNGGQQWNNFSETFNLNGERLLQRIYNDGGTYRFFYWDPTQGQNWTNFDEEFDAAGGRHTQRLVYDDGSTRNFYWDVNGSFNWTTFDEEYTAGPNATRAIQRVNYDDGTSSQQFWDTNNSQAYSTYVDYMNAAGQRVEQRIFHDQGGNTGGYTRYFYDPANLQPWSSRTDVYNAAGALVSSTQVPG